MSATGMLPILHGASSVRPDWRGFSPHQLSVPLFLHGYLVEPPEEFDVAATLSFALEALEDFEGAA